MDFKLVKINKKMGKKVYEMYQHIPNNEIESDNPAKGVSYDEFKKLIAKWIDEETNPDLMYNVTTNRYIFYVDNEPVGELGLRTTQTNFWIYFGNQMFFKVREDYRNKGYGKKMVKLGVDEARNLNFPSLRINCDDRNTYAIKILTDLGARLDVKGYGNNFDGTSNSYLFERLN